MKKVSSGTKRTNDLWKVAVFNIISLGARKLGMSRNFGEIAKNREKSRPRQIDIPTDR